MKTYFDIGANIGKWTIQNINNCDRIIIVEASYITYNDLINNLKNKIIYESDFIKNRVVAINYAVTSSPEPYIDFYQSIRSDLSSTKKEWFGDKSRFNNIPYTKIRAKTISIDSLIEKYGTPELIKIDVEGAEYEAILSLTKKVNTLCFEWTSDDIESIKKSIDYLISIGFSQFSIQFKDNYTYRPEKYSNRDDIIKTLYNLKPHNHNVSTNLDDWGMIWCN